MGTTSQVGIDVVVGGAESQLGSFIFQSEKKDEGKFDDGFELGNDDGCECESSYEMLHEKFKICFSINNSSTMNKIWN